MARIFAISHSWPKGGVGAAAARDRGRHPAQTNTSDGPTVFAHACRLGAEGIVSKKAMARIDLARVASGSKSAIPPASRCSGSAARIGIGEPPAVRADDDSPRD